MYNLPFCAPFLLGREFAKLRDLHFSGCVTSLNVRYLEQVNKQDSEADSRGKYNPKSDYLGY